MREIKFRGQRVDNGEWVYGYFVKDPKGECRIYWQPFPDAKSNTYHFVKEETIGQYTGLKDKNGVDIYEGDKCKRDRHAGTYEIVFYKSAWAIKTEDEKAIWHQEFCNGATSKELEVTGNIYEPINP